MNEQILHFTQAEYRSTFEREPEDPVPFYIAHTPPKWNGEIECVSLCRAEQADLDALAAVQLGNYTTGLEPGAQDVIDRCYSTAPVERFDDNGDPFDPPEYYYPPTEIGAFA